MSEEKFISINYETWQNKYLPMEEKLKKVEQELEEEKASKKILVSLDWFPYRYGSIVGREDFSTRILGTIEYGVLEDKITLPKKLINNINVPLINQAITSIFLGSNVHRKKFVLKSELDETIAKLAKKENLLKEKEYQLLKTETMLKNHEEILSGAYRKLFEEKQKIKLPRLINKIVNFFNKQKNV